MRAPTAFLVVIVALVGCDSIAGIDDHALNPMPDVAPGLDLDGGDAASAIADASGDGGDSDGDAECMTGALRCDGNAPQACVAGTWQGLIGVCRLDARLLEWRMRHVSHDGRYSFDVASRHR